ncbi:28 kDa ribonucleoprotein, chloroplastic-like isoform X2 [Impatiens glandulifera]|uniref:28 kDa ribonucleoprotein, chloroplastic-like isoform X2 n=1 Tax=Impatiens glandulifera TaxID=253017 RepID=UPI001FB199A1|nr:28 kDa ribonucleoprotein, chloroplastic-like isoform X2 [Impatiens glandulifera]
MAATAASSIGSSFSTSIQTHKAIRSKSSSSSSSFDHLFKITLYRPILHFPGLTSQFIAIESPSHLAQRWRLPAVELEGEGEGVGDGENLSSEEEEAAESSSGGLNTKLYFGNLPYNCDSAQLAGIIQDYASPELIEVLYNRDTGRSRGFAFAIMSSIEDCNAVIENLDGCVGSFNLEVEH